MRWKCHYGYYEAKTPSLTYVVNKQWRRGEYMWYALMADESEQQLKEVPGLLPLTRRQAMRNCETHAKEYAHE